MYLTAASTFIVLAQFVIYGQALHLGQSNDVLYARDVPEYHDAHIFGRSLDNDLHRFQRRSPSPKSTGSKTSKSQKPYKHDSSKSSNKDYKQDSSKPNKSSSKQSKNSSPFGGLGAVGSRALAAGQKAFQAGHSPMDVLSGAMRGGLRGFTQQLGGKMRRDMDEEELEAREVDVDLWDDGF